MSFSIDVKDELTRVKGECAQCDVAMLSALVQSLGTLHLQGQGKFSVQIATESASIARFVIKCLHDIFDLKTELTLRRNTLNKGPNYSIELVAGKKLTDALVYMGIFTKDKNGTHINEGGIAEKFRKKPCCSAAYLRGAFLGHGFISEPSGNFHFEIVFERENLAREVVEFLHTSNVNANFCERRGKYLVYIKNGEGITEFLALTGAHKNALKLEDVRVLKSIRNDENRKINFEMANSARSADAAAHQLQTIKRVVDYYGVKSLPASIRQFIQLRVADTEASLAELGAMADPPLSKSALYNRACRLEKMAADIPKN